MKLMLSNTWIREFYKLRHVLIVHEHGYYERYRKQAGEVYDRRHINFRHLSPLTLYSYDIAAKVPFFSCSTPYLMSAVLLSWNILSIGKPKYAKKTQKLFKSTKRITFVDNGQDLVSNYYYIY